MIYSPCLNCPNRTIECHGKCEKYNEFRKTLINEKKKERKRQYLDKMTNPIDGYTWNIGGKK